MSPETLAIKLRQARGAMSLVEAAQLSEIPEERIRMYEEGVRRPYGKTLRRLADVYGVRVAELVGPGQVTRARGRAPEVRRRRRIVAREEGSAIAVPVEVTEGETVRLVIELVVRRREGAAPLEDGPVKQEGGGALVEPLRVPSSPPTPSRGEPGDARAVGERGVEAEPAIRRLRLADEPGRQPRDPILELRQAYRDFRHKKK